MNVSLPVLLFRFKCLCVCVVGFIWKKYLTKADEVKF